MQCEEWANANSELFKEAHDETVHKNSYKRKLYELISASLGTRANGCVAVAQGAKTVVGALLEIRGTIINKTFTTALAGDGKAAPPLVADATTFPPLKRGTMGAVHLC